jgi:PKD repeat protein
MCGRARIALCLFLALATVVEAVAITEVAAAAIPPGGVNVSFTWSPQSPLVGQPVTFTSTSAAGTGNAITAQQWDLDDDGRFDDHKGRKATTGFSTPGGHVVTLRVVDSHGAAHNHVRAETVNVVSVNQPPVASFVYHPAPPVAGQPVSFYSTATDPDSAIAVQRWDLDGNGSYGDAVGPTAAVSFPARGNYNVGLQVEDTVGAVSTVVGSVAVADSSVAASLAARPLFPSPVVRLSGMITKRGIRIRRLTVDAPPGSTTAVRCRGRHCPFRWRRYTHRAVVPPQVVRVRSLDGRSLRTGIKLQVFVTRANAIGRYTSFRIRTSRSPVRLDRCLISLSTKPVRCAAE